MSGCCVHLQSILGPEALATRNALVTEAVREVDTLNVVAHFCPLWSALGADCAVVASALWLVSHKLVEVLGVLHPRYKGLAWLVQ